MELIYCPAMSVTNYNPTPRNIPEEQIRLDTVNLHVRWDKNSPYDEKRSFDNEHDDDDDEGQCV